MIYFFSFIIMFYNYLLLTVYKLCALMYCILYASAVLDAQDKIKLITRLNARLQPNIGFTLRRVLAVFTRSAITPPKVNRFVWNLNDSEYIVGGWPCQICGAIRAVATAGESGVILFCQVSNVRFHRFPIGQISRNLNTTLWSVSRWKLSEQIFENFT